MRDVIAHDPAELARRVAPIAAALDGAGSWLVGGAVRDLLLGRPVTDWDVLVADGEVAEAARRYARRSGGAPFALSDRHGAWRVVDGPRTVDFTALADGDLGVDLRRRDLTINAVAVRLADGRVEDPLGGLGDLERGLLRACGDDVFRADPLRLLRVARIAVELGMEVEDGTAAQCRRDAALAPEAAPERTAAELARILGSRDPVDGVLLLERLGVLATVLPELAALRGVEQSGFHHLDVLEHTLHVVESTLDVADHVGHYLPDAAVATAVADALAEPVESTLVVRDALRWAALLHDIAKPQTRTTFPDGRVGFPDHARQGAAVADAILARLAAGNGLRRAVAVLVREHLRLGFLVRDLPFSARTVVAYAEATEPCVHASIVLSLGDRLATRGARTRQRGLRRHQEAAQEMAAGYEAMRRRLATPLVRGDVLAAALGIAPGPQLGAAVKVVRDAQAAGEVETEDEAIAAGRAWLAAGAG